MNRKILQLAIPSIVSNITVPLLGLVDVAIVGHLGSASYIGAIAVGGMLFNMIYWIFGFLRMGTSGMTAQVYGKRDLTEVVRTLLRAVGVGLLISLGLWILQSPILRGAFVLIDALSVIERHAHFKPGGMARKLMGELERTLTVAVEGDDNAVAGIGL